jgi:phosphate transport system permease protein
VVYGVLGFAVFVRALGMGRSLIAGALTLALLVLPIIVVATREALRTVPFSLREQCYALGATQWQAIRSVVLPTALPGIATAVILALSRALGETAPLVVVGALTYVTFLPDGLNAPFTALPIQIWSWVSRPQADFVANAAAGVVVLLALLALTNAVAVILRDRASRWTP